MNDLPLGELFATALRIQNLLLKHGIRFCFIGGVAVQRWGRVRITNDVDLTIFAGFGDEKRYIDIMTSLFQPRREDFLSFALDYRILLLSDANSVGIDISLGALPYEDEMIGRASPYQFSPIHNLITCSAEDLLILKAYANRDQDWFDIRNILVRFHDTVDKTLVFDMVQELAMLKNEPAITEKLLKLWNDL